MFLSAFVYAAVALHRRDNGFQDHCRQNDVYLLSLQEEEEEEEDRQKYAYFSSYLAYMCQ